MESENEQMKKAEIEQMKKEIAGLKRLNFELRMELEEVKERSDARFQKMKRNPLTDF